MCVLSQFSYLFVALVILIVSLFWKLGESAPTIKEFSTYFVPLIEQRGITLIGIALSNLEDDAAIQLALPLDRDRASPLDAALDDIRERFGANAVTRAVLLGRDQGISVPLLPD